MKTILVRMLLLAIILIPPGVIGTIYLVAKKEQAKKLAKWEGVNPASVARAEDPDDVVKGGQIYRQHCATCHGPEGGGGLGKPLNHEGLLGEPGHAFLMTVLANGVQGTPMASWKGVLGPEEAAMVAAHVQRLAAAHQSDSGGEPAP